MIIDFHTHIFPDKIAAGAISNLAANASVVPHSDGTESGLLFAMERSGVDIAVNLPVLTKPRQFESTFDFAKALNEKNDTGRRIISFAGIHPQSEEIEEQLEAIARAGFVGIKIHPEYQNTFIDDDACVRLLAAAKKLGLVTVTHSGLDGAYIGEPIRCTPRRVLNLLDKIGGYDRLVLAHFGACGIFDEVYEHLAGEDVYFDTAHTLPYVSRTYFEKVVAKHGDKKILFATDSPWDDIGADVSILRSYAMGEETEKRIFCKNAAELLGLELNRA